MNLCVYILLYKLRGSKGVFNEVLRRKRRVQEEKEGSKGKRRGPRGTTFPLKYLITIILASTCVSNLQVMNIIVHSDAID